MRYGYARVSTKGQQRDGNSLEAQDKALREAGAEVIYTEAFTGTKKERPKFSELLEKLQPGDTLIVTKLDRFARSIAQGTTLVNELIEKGVKVHILNLGILDNTPASKLIRNVFFAFAEFERDMIVERTSEGKETARQNPDFKDGRPKKEVDMVEYRRLQAEVASGGITVAAACKELGIGRTKWYEVEKTVKK